MNCKGEIFYIGRVHLKAEYSIKVTDGRIAAKDITMEMLHEVNHQLWRESKAVVYKQRTLVNGMLAWKTTLVKGDESLRFMIDTFPMVDVQEVSSNAKLYSQGESTIGYFESHDEFISAYKNRLKGEGFEFMGYNDCPIADGEYVGFLNIITDDGQFRINYK